ncbi:Oidioi.mRNA.OKI2018_I69.PAR.g11769.t1.cds [Oikopleura dioica]|uniref:Oidioi.mRNA.OKI2018_I69.PAR.g11769.t1.cds n=1 Tax=Oikopleura dioica TaxID=34765 RepID=A0ABN7S3Z4_OIKDI|nr:Oidioi.mRNA.OKI2018_I69.PAR.g11769.t1.cds [Oikopleura dioica]
MKKNASVEEKSAKVVPKRLTKDTKTVSFDVFSLHSTDSNTFSRVDIIEELLSRDSKCAFNNKLVPMLKMKCLHNLHAELVNIEINEEYEHPRAKRFQIVKMLLSDEKLVKKITFCSTQMGRHQTPAWDKHSMWQMYDFSLEKYDSTLVSFIRFFRNHHSHIYEIGEDFHRNLLRSRRIDDSRFCDLIEKKFPSLLSFLITLYLAACDEKDEMRKLFSSYSENADLLLFEDLESFLADTIRKHFPNLQGKFVFQLDKFLQKKIIFDGNGNFVTLW